MKPASFDDTTATFERIRGHLDSRSVPVRREENENPLVNKALEIISKKTATCSLASIAVELGVNSSHLSRLFKTKTGENFQNFLIKQKMQIAAQMLESKVEYKNSEIAKATGYTDVQNFCRIFELSFFDIEANNSAVYRPKSEK